MPSPLHWPRTRFLPPLPHPPLRRANTLADAAGVKDEVKGTGVFSSFELKRPSVEGVQPPAPKESKAQPASLTGKKPK